MKIGTLVSTLTFIVGILLISFFPGCARTDHPQGAATAAKYLFIWAGDADEKDSDFLAVIDARRLEPTYGQVVATVPVGARATMPHHTEYEYPSSEILFANGWVAGRTFMIDLRDPLEPRLVVTGGGGSWVLIVELDEETGELTVDEAFRDKGASHAGIDFDRLQWPHGETGAAIVHGALFSK